MSKIERKHHQKRITIHLLNNYVFNISDKEFNQISKKIVSEHIDKFIIDDRFIYNVNNISFVHKSKHCPYYQVIFKDGYYIAVTNKIYNEIIQKQKEQKCLNNFIHMKDKIYNIDDIMYIINI